MDQKIIKNIVEAALFAAGRPMSVNEMLRLFSEDERPERKIMRDILEQLLDDYTDRGIELVEVASGYRIQVRQQMGEWLGRLSERKPPRYSRASMETLALIAYRQPITRGDIEEVRGVSVSSNIIRTLLERGWIRIVGHRDVPGRPAMFGTTKDFLDYFNLKSLDELPSLAELQDIDSINAELDFGDAMSGGDDDQLEGITYLTMASPDEMLSDDTGTDAEDHDDFGHDPLMTTDDNDDQASGVEQSRSNADEDPEGDADATVNALDADTDTPVDDADAERSGVSVDGGDDKGEDDATDTTASAQTLSA